MMISLKAARINAGFKQIDAANSIGVKKQTISAWESGKSEPKVSQFKKLCELYGTSSENVFLPSESILNG